MFSICGYFDLLDFPAISIFRFIEKRTLPAAIDSTAASVLSLLEWFSESIDGAAEWIIVVEINEGSFGRAAILVAWIGLVGIDNGGIWVIVVCIDTGTAVNGWGLVGKGCMIVTAICVGDASVTDNCKSSEEGWKSMMLTWVGTGDNIAGKVFIAETSPISLSCDLTSSIVAVAVITSARFPFWLGFSHALCWCAVCCSNHKICGFAASKSVAVFGCVLLLSSTQILRAQLQY